MASSGLAIDQMYKRFHKEFPLTGNTTTPYSKIKRKFCLQFDFEIFAFNKKMKEKNNINYNSSNIDDYHYKMFKFKQGKNGNIQDNWEFLCVGFCFIFRLNILNYLFQFLVTPEEILLI